MRCSEKKKSVMPFAQRMDKEEAICLNEHRSVVTTVECEDDIFFDMGSLICELDDICLFELLADVDATIYEL